eukprot:gene8435-261_t
MTEEIVEQQTMDNSVLNDIFGSNDGVVIKQKTDVLELLSGFEMSNKYGATFSNGKTLLALEDSNCCARMYLGPNRCFKMHVYTDNKKEVLTFERPYAFCFPSIEVYDPTSTEKKLLGRVQSRFAFCSKELSVLDANEQEIYHIHGPAMCPWTFNITENGQEVGLIKKKFSGLVKELFTDSDNFGVSFPKSATPTMKMLYLQLRFS